MVVKQYELRVQLSPKECYEALREGGDEQNLWKNIVNNPTTYTLAWNWDDTWLEGTPTLESGQGGGFTVRISGQSNSWSEGTRSIRVTLRLDEDETVILCSGKNTATGANAMDSLERGMRGAMELFRQSLLGSLLRGHK